MKNRNVLYRLGRPERKLFSLDLKDVTRAAFKTTGKYFLFGPPRPVNNIYVHEKAGDFAKALNDFFHIRQCNPLSHISEVNGLDAHEDAATNPVRQSKNTNREFLFLSHKSDVRRRLGCPSRHSFSVIVNYKILITSQVRYGRHTRSIIVGS